MVYSRYKLKKLGIDNEMYWWIEDFLTDRTIQVKIGNEFSRVVQLENGVPKDGYWVQFYF